MANILIFHPAFILSGEDLILAHMVRALVKNSHSVTVATCASVPQNLDAFMGRLNIIMVCL